MKIYFANMFGAKGLERFLRRKIDILASFSSFPKAGEIHKPPFCKRLFLDSGAFGKNSHKVTINSYANFLKANLSKIHIYANLDVIGNARASYSNLQKLEAKGLAPLPVFHCGSSVKWLDELLGQYDYIALGGLVPISGNYERMRAFLDSTWTYILKQSKNLRVHGFGIQNIDIMKRYPWYSVDASSVHMQARYGGVMTPYGWMKINPNVNSKEVRWQTPLHLEEVQKFVSTHLDFPFDLAQQQTPEGVLARSAISIHYYISEFENHVCEVDKIKAIRWF